MQQSGILLQFALDLSPMMTSAVQQTLLLGILLSSFELYFCAPTLSPIVIFPGVGGNRLEAKLNKPSTVHFFCEKTSDWSTIWIDAGDLLPETFDCWADNFRMQFKNGSFTNNTGVQIRTVGFGNTSAVEYLDSGTTKVGAYFNVFIDYFVNLGYKRGQTIRAAPYDWRLTPDLLNRVGYYAQVVDLIESTYTANNNTPVTLVSHSYGGPISLYLLTEIVDQAWKELYLHAYIPLSGPWKGSAKAAGTLASGDNLGIVTVRPLWARSEQRTLPSSYYFLPVPSDAWNTEDVFIASPKGNFSAYNYDAFFKSLDFKDGSTINNAVDRIPLVNLPAPNVTTHCLYGNQVDTHYQYVYKGSKYPDKIDHIVMGPGDGTVNLPSLQACHKWKGMQQAMFNFKEFKGVIHFDIVSYKPALDYIKSIVVSN